MSDIFMDDPDSDSDSQLSSVSWGRSWGSRSPGAPDDPDSGSDASTTTTGFRRVRGYPLDVESVYRSFPPCSPPPPASPSDDNNIDPGARKFTAYYDVDLLDRTKTADVIAAVRADRGDQSYAVLRKKWRTRFQRAGNGSWDHVEYVPAWTDPDWDERYVCLRGPGQDTVWPSDLPPASLYARRSGMQIQRPALRPGDATALNPTAGAKRWGVYPYRRAGAGTGTNPQQQQQQSAGTSSGVTPTQPGFPTVRLDFPQWSDDKNSAWLEVTVEDLNAARAQHRAQVGDAAASEEAFRAYLANLATVYPRGTLLWDQADKLLRLLDLVADRETREEYQRLLFSGNTTNELVRNGAWTMGMDATFDIGDAPLHDLVSRDKWANTVGRGVNPDDPRIVYDISGRRGEMTAYNDEIWQALQPALHLVSKFLASDHPILLSWADLRKLEPVRDERAMGRDESVAGIDFRHNNLGIYRHDLFSVWPGFSGLEEDMGPIIRRWNDISVLIKAGFDSTKYVCGILKHSIEWNLMPMYRIGQMHVQDPDDPDPFWGTAVMSLSDAPGSTRPFKCRINLAAEYIWQLLVDDYSPAEKAAVSFSLAVTMMHELAHALRLSRLQLCGPEPVDPAKPNQDLYDPTPTDMPLWLQINPAWRSEILALESQTSSEIFKALRVHGLRHKLSESSYAGGEIVTEYEDYMEDDPEFEEGRATEHRCFGGITQPLSMGSTLFSSDLMDPPRYLSEILLMPALAHWRKDIARPEVFNMLQALPAETYLKLFRRDFWEGSFRAFGHEATKLASEQPLQATISMGISGSKRNALRQKFGRHAADWISNAHGRLTEETDNEVLWRWLYYRTVHSIEHLGAQDAWARARDYWGSIDLAIWRSARALKSVNDEVRTIIIDRAPSAGVFDTGPRLITRQRIRSAHSDPLEVLQFFRDLYAELRSLARDLNREATWNQNMAAAWARLEDVGTQQTMHQVYANKFRARMGLIYIRTVQEMSQLLDSWDFHNDMTLALLNATDGVREIMDEGRDMLRSQFGALETAFGAAMGIFSDNDGEERRLALQNLNAIPPGAVKSHAGRIGRMAKLEYSRLPAGSSLKNIADDWMLILQSGGVLTDPAPGSQADAFNQALQSRNRSIDMTIDAQRQAAEAAHPDPQDVVQEQVSSLSQQQPQNAGLSDQQQQQQQNAAAVAAGYRPFVDPQTGFTRYERVQGFVGDLAPVAPMAPMAPMDPNFANSPNRNPQSGQNRGWQQGPWRP